MYTILWPLCQSVNVMGQNNVIFIKMLLIPIHLMPWQQEPKNINSTLFSACCILHNGQCNRYESEVKNHFQCTDCPMTQKHNDAFRFSVKWYQAACAPCQLSFKLGQQRHLKKTPSLSNVLKRETSAIHFLQKCGRSE